MSLIAWYKLDGNGNDSSGNDYHSTSINNISWVDGKINQCAEFNGVNSTIRFGVGNTFYPLPHLSISIWFKSYGVTATTGTSPGLFGFTYGIRCFVHNDFIKFTVDNGTTNTSINSPSVYNFHNDDKWHHATFTISPTQRKLYIDGELCGTRNDTWLGYTPYAYNTWNIGRDNNNTMYYFTGLMDDLRLYNHVLSAKEVKELSHAKVLHYKFNKNEYDNYVTRDSSGYGNDANIISNTPEWSNNSKIGSGCYEFVNGINDYVSIPDNIIDLTQDFTVSTWINTTDSDHNPRILCIVNGTGNFTFGYNAGGKQLVCRFQDNPVYSNDSITPGEWNHIACVLKDNIRYFYINGEYVSHSGGGFSANAAFSAIGSGHSDTYSFTGLLDDPRIYASALSSDDIKELYQTRSSLDNHGNFYTNEIIETNHKPLLLDYTTWENGQTGGVGVFNSNGDINENYRILDNDPWGKETVIWEARPNSDHDADGGWNSDLFDIDNTKMYRFSTWVYRTVQGNGSFYLGVRTDDDTTAVLRKDTNAIQTNPYFHVEGISPSQGWILVVGHVWPAGSSTGSNHIDSGIYNINGKISDINRVDYIWNNNTVYGLHRSYLYYSSNVSTRQRWVYPRMDICDGTEPSIAELIAGHDSRNIDLLRTIGGESQVNLKVSDDITYVGSSYELGPTEGLVGYWSLDGDTKDYSGNENHGINDGAIITSGINNKSAYYFDGTGTIDGTIPGSYIDIPENITNTNDYPNGCTYSIWINVDVSAVNRMSLFYGRGTSQHIEINSDSKNFRTEASLQNGYNFGSGVFPDNIKGAWGHFAIVFANNEINRPVRWYQNGVLFDTDSLDNGDYPGTEYFQFNKLGRSTGNTTYDYAKSFHGKMQDFRIYDRALSAEEIYTLYQSNNEINKLKISDNSIYINNIMEL